MNHTMGQTRLLVVDDEEGLLFLMSERLTSLGYEVLTAPSGEEALQMAEQHSPDLILLDILMPQMKGREVCAHLKANPKTQPIPIIFLTALGMPDHIKEGLNLGGEDYLVKPVEPDELKDRIEVCLARHRNKASAG